jgi:glucan phosphoethanolaminetransferase (alkaline phosphatase superfamily)
MTLKRLALVNLIISTILIFLFYYKFQIRLRAIPVHLIIIFYGMLFIYYLGVLLTKFLSKRISTIIITILFILFYLFMINIYLGFYIAHKNWGHPLTIDILIVYLNEIDYLLKSLPVKISKYLIFLALFLVFVIVTIPFLLNSKQFFNEFKQHSNSFLTKKNIFLGIGLYIIFPVLFFSIEWMQKRVSSDDPIVAFFLYEFNPQNEIVKSIGQENYLAKINYPKNLSFNKKNVILITCDALRYDHLSSNGYIRKVSPFLDSISNLKNTTNLEHFYSTSSRSFIGITNILSSNYSVTHQNFFIHDLLKKQGYSINFILSGDHTNFFGLKKYYGKSIDFYQDGIDAKKNNSRVSINDDLNILNTLQNFPKYNNIPAFFYFHFMSSHQLGILNPSFKIYKPSKYNSFLKTVPKSILINDYDNRITQLDKYLKRAFLILNEKGYLKNSIIVITSDHGQALGERNMVSHGNSTYVNETLIPLIILDYSENKKNTTNKLISDFNNQLDIIPTIIDLLNIPKPKTWKGSSIFSLRSSAYIFQQEKNYYSCIWSESGEIHQYVYNSLTQKEELFNITANKYETRNIIDSFSKENLTVIKTKMKKFYAIKY